MLNQLFTTKKTQGQDFVNQKRVPITVLQVEKQVVTATKNTDKDGYFAVQVAIGQKNKKANKPLTGHFKASKIEFQPRFTREIRLSEVSELTPGSDLPLDQIIAEGDRVKVTSTSKGKGFAGVMKRHGFHGGPKTHGQSDRARAPGSIGRGTTPGRVVKGKKMAGRMGGETSTIKNLKVLKVDLENNLITLKGLVPGAKGGLVRLTVTKKNQSPIIKEPIAPAQVEAPATDTQEAVTE